MDEKVIRTELQMQNSPNARLLTQAGWTQQATADWFGVSDTAIRTELQMHKGSGTRLLTQAGWTQQATADWFGVGQKSVSTDVQMQTGTNTRLLTDAAYLSACQPPQKLCDPPPDMEEGLKSAGRGIPIT